MAELYQHARRLPLSHLSIRVPWHDSGWNGTVCQNPKNNVACLVLARVRETRDDELETKNAGKRWDELPRNELPACVAERGSIMSPFEINRVANHPYQSFGNMHGHFAPTTYVHPAYSAACIPFKWMMRTFVETSPWNGIGIAERLDLKYDPSIEPAKGELGLASDSIWIQHHHNQHIMLDTFFSAIHNDESLCIFYAKDTPLTDDTRRVIIGIGRVTHVGNITEYDYEKDTDGDWRSYLWERSIHHSIRPDFRDGFLLPYKEILDAAEADPTINPADYVAFAPDEYWDAFSYGSAHVSHDATISALLACVRSLRKMGEVIPGRWDTIENWIDSEINRLWEMRGPFPGLGSALSAFGIENGSLVAHEISLKMERGKEWNEDPWDYVDSALKNPAELPITGQNLTKSHLDVWNALKPDRLELLKLLSRFEISADQATQYYQPTERKKRGIDVSDNEILNNPYLLYELDRLRVDSITIGLIDRGVFPDKIVRDKYPLHERSRLDGPIDKRRVRAFTIHQLEIAALNGHSLQPRDTIIQAIRDMDVQPECAVSIDVMNVVEKFFNLSIHIDTMSDGKTSYQLDRLRRVGEVIRTTVERRSMGRPHQGFDDCISGIELQLAAMKNQLDKDQKALADEETIAALRVLYESRISVLLGPAGTGKTTLLKILCYLSGIDQNVLLLAPTGKARVRMETQTEITGAKTIAQFLHPERYDGSTGNYRLSEAAKKEAVNTVIIDEASMLTEEQLAAIIDALKPPQRLILVGDARQLPPIGTGRPFLDIVRRLKPEDAESMFPKVAPSYAELTVPKRQIGDANRADMMLAEWFNGDPVSAGSDEIWYKLQREENLEHLRLVQWDNSDDLTEKFLNVIQEELKLESQDDTQGFETSLGGKPSNGYIYFNRGNTAKKVESWQILSPVRGESHGVTSLNRFIQDHFRAETKRWTIERAMVPKPLGNEGIIYGDKVINVTNRRRPSVYPETNALKYVANGEIGMVVGQFKPKNWKGRPKILEVEFSSQEGFAYAYTKGRDFSDENGATLELAYALTVHKTQGSEFGITFVIIPNPCRILSRELLYTAFTRQQEKLVIFYKGSFSELYKYTTEDYSEISKRLTNLFERPHPIELPEQNTFLEKGLIHRTKGGERVRSKSEIVIADSLRDAKIEYEYEAEFVGKDGKKRRPDFTIENQDMGFTVIWEHLGMLHDPIYKARWERKLIWYREQGVLEESEGSGSEVILVVTRDDERGGLDSSEIEAIIKRVFGV